MKTSYHPGADPEKNIENICQAILQNQQLRGRFGLGSGCLGQSVFMCLYGSHTGRSAWLEKSSDLFDKACSLVDTDPSIVCPKDFSDLGSVVHFLTEAGALDVDPGHFLADVDDFLKDGMDHAISQGTIAGFRQGAVGYGLYFLHRARHNPQAFSKTVLELAETLDRLAIKNPLGHYWPVIPKRPATTADLTLANGQASVVLLLTAVAESTLVDPASILPTMEMAVTYINSCLKLTRGYTLSLSFHEGLLGTGYALLRAGMVFSAPEWSALGEAIIKQCAQTCLETSAFPNMGITSGASGMALLFDRVHRITGHLIYKDTARHCYQHLLRLTATQLKARPSIEDIPVAGSALIRSLGGLDFDRLVWLI
ncbi:MAG: hypothetical protein ABS46_02205 [Cytophagaceae bacterium SCN 52-12]|mgnify:CR=1 FL=1|nr:MAG: hypothetical protein ABS46_02205 [Cytophagaceae bacterium SCN 52-12]